MSPHTDAGALLKLADSIEQGHARVVHLNEYTQWALYKNDVVVAALRQAASQCREGGERSEVQTNYAQRGEIADAIREYCHSVSPAAVQNSHGVERIYYSGISLDGLTDAVFAILGRAQPSRRSIIDECVKAAQSFVYHETSHLDQELVDMIADNTKDAIIEKLRALALSSTQSGGGK